MRLLTKKLRTLVLTCLLGVPTGLYAQSTEAPLVASFFDHPVTNFSFLAPDGTRTGFMIELTELISDETGIPVAYREYPTVMDAIGAQLRGETHILAGVARLSALEDGLIFSDPVARGQSRIAVRAEDLAKYKSGTYEGLRIGFIPPALDNAEIALLAENTQVEFAETTTALMALMLGRVDALLLPETVAFWVAKEAGIDQRIAFVNDPLRTYDRVVALSPSRADLMPRINAAIATLEEDGRLPALRAKYSIDVPAPPPDVLTVGVPAFPPYHIVAEDGAVSGFAVEVFADLAEIAGIEYRFKPITTEEWRAGAGPDTFDVLPQLSVNAERRETYDFTLPIEVSSQSIFLGPDVDRDVTGLNDLTGLRVGAVRSSVALARIPETPGFTVTLFDGGAELAAGLAAGAVDAALFAPDVFAQELAKIEDGERITQVPEPFYRTERAIALRFGLGTVREQLNAVIPGYVVSDRYEALVETYFAPPVFWTPLRVRIALGAVAALMVAIIATATALQLRARARAQIAREVAVVRDELQTVFDAASSGIVALDTEGRVVRLNNKARHFLGGISDPVPFPWPDPIHFLEAETLQPLDDSADPVRRALSGHSLRNETHLMRRTMGKEDHRYVRVSSALVENAASVVHLVLVIDDVSNEERNRQVVERKSRLDALGQVTGGIAHDFNNLLASQLYAVDLARGAEDPAKRDTYLDIAASSIKRGRSLTSRLLAFARRQPGLASVKRTEEVFEEFQKLVRPMLEAQFEITCKVEQPDLRHYCDQVQLETALMNLVLNSRDAMLREGKGSRIELKARAVRVSDRLPDQVDLSKGMPEGLSFRYIEISVSDNGPGMDAETVQRCTDPFFTTKDSNSGTGLGLSMVYGFVRQSDGDLRIYSEEGVGTTVQMILPRGTALGVREEPVATDVMAEGAGQTILLVEDEGQLLDVMTDVVSNMGYEVVAARSGQEALELVQDGLAFDLLLTDVVMPGSFGGFELARRVRALRADLPVIYTSGYTGFTASEMGAVQAPLLQKPASPPELAEAIGKALAGEL